MKVKWNRLISLALALCITVGMLPMTAMATVVGDVCYATTPEQLVDGLKNTNVKEVVWSGTETVVANNWDEENRWISANRNVTLTLKTDLTINSESTEYFMKIGDNTKLTIVSAGNVRRTLTSEMYGTRLGTLFDGDKYDVTIQSVKVVSEMKTKIETNYGYDLRCIFGAEELNLNLQGSAYLKMQRFLLANPYSSEFCNLNLTMGTDCVLESVLYGELYGNLFEDIDTMSVKTQPGAKFIVHSDAISFLRESQDKDDDLIAVPMREAGLIEYEMMSYEAICQGLIGTKSNPLILADNILCEGTADFINQDFGRTFYVQLPELADGEEFNFNGFDITSPDLVIDLNGQTLRTDHSGGGYVKESNSDKRNGWPDEKIEYYNDYYGQTFDRITGVEDYLLKEYHSSGDEKGYKIEIKNGNDLGAKSAITIRENAKLTIIDSSEPDSSGNKSGKVVADAIPWYEDREKESLNGYNDGYTAGAIILDILTLGMFTAGVSATNFHETLYVQRPENQMFNIKSDGEMVVDDGNFIFTPHTSSRSKTNETRPTIFMVDGGKLTVNDGSFTANGVADHAQVIGTPIRAHITNSDTKVIINDGNFHSSYRGHSMLMNVGDDISESTIISWLQDSSSIPIQIREGTFFGASGNMANYEDLKVLGSIYDGSYDHYTKVNQVIYNGLNKISKDNVLSQGPINIIDYNNISLNHYGGMVIQPNTPYVKPIVAEPAEIKGVTFEADGDTDCIFTYEQFKNGITATVAAVAGDGGDLSYQWYINDKMVNGATGATFTIEDNKNEDFFWHTNYKGERVRNFFDEGNLLCTVYLRCVVTNTINERTTRCNSQEKSFQMVRTPKPTPNPDDITIKAIDDDSIRLDGLHEDYILSTDSWSYLPVDDGATGDNVYGLEAGEKIGIYNKAQIDEEYTVDSEKIYITVNQMIPPVVIDYGTPGLNQVSTLPVKTVQDGSLLGVTADMEWRQKGTAEWKTGDGKAIANLFPGIYEVRNKGTDKLYSKPVEVEISMMMGAAAVIASALFKESDGTINELYLLDNGNYSWGKGQFIDVFDDVDYDKDTETLNFKGLSLGNASNPITMNLSSNIKELVIDEDTVCYGSISTPDELTISGDKTLTINHGYGEYDGTALDVNRHLTIENTKIVINGNKDYDDDLTGIEVDTSYYVILKGGAKVTIIEPRTATDHTSSGIICSKLYLLDKSIVNSTVGSFSAPAQKDSYALKTNDMYMYGGGPYEFYATVYGTSEIRPFCARSTGEAIAIHQDPDRSYRELDDTKSGVDVITNQKYQHQYNGFMSIKQPNTVNSIEITLHEGEIGNSLATIAEGSTINPETWGGKPFHATAKVNGTDGVPQDVIWTWESDDIPDDENIAILYALMLNPDGSLLLWGLNSQKTYTIVATSLVDSSVQARFTFTVGDPMEKLAGTVKLTLEDGKTVPREGDVITADTSGITNGTGQYTYDWNYHINGEFGERGSFETTTPSITITEDMVGTGVNLYVRVTDRERSRSVSSQTIYDISPYVPGEPQVTGVRVSPSKITVNPGGSVRLSAWQLGIDLSDTPVFAWSVSQNYRYCDAIIPDANTKGCTVSIVDNAPIGSEIRVLVESEGQSVVSTIVVVEKEINNLLGVHQQDITYGEEISPEPIFANGAKESNGGAIIYKYKSSSASSSTPFTSTKPTAQGIYLVQATSYASGGVDEISVQDSFTIYGIEPNESAVLKNINLKVNTDGEQSVDLSPYIPADANNVVIKTTAYGPTEDAPEIAAMFKNSNVLRNETGNYATFELEGEKVGDEGQVITAITSDNYATILVMIKVTIVDKLPQNLTFSTNHYNKTTADVGSSFTNVLTGAVTDVTYSVSGDTGILTVDNNGIVTLTGVAGVAAIVATAEETENYAKANAVYVVEVTSDKTLYQVTVCDGTGSGKYAPGDTVTITATPPEGKHFSKWSVESGEITLDDETSATTTFCMTDSSVKITAIFTEAPASLLGDVNKDGIVNLVDLNLVWNSANYNKLVGVADNPSTDINGDGTINLVDLNIIWNSANYNKGSSN